MAFYSYMFTANYRRFFKKLKAVAKTEHRFFPGLVLDTGWCVFRYGMALSDYLNYRLYSRTRQERKRYAGVRHQNKFYAITSPYAKGRRFNEKPVFLQEFADCIGRDFIVPDESNWEAVKAFLLAHEAFMEKPYAGLGGQGVRKVYTRDIPDLSAYWKHCAESKLFLEELVIQHPKMNELSPASINTLRIMTFHGGDETRILWMGQRVGNGVNAVDNFHAGGIAIAVDLDTGCLKGVGIDKDNRPHAVHPTTGTPFDGFRIPCFEEVKALVLKAAAVDDDIHVVGWDVAISEKGPVLIEGNRRAGFDMVQTLDDRGRLDMMESVLASLGEKL